MCSFEIRRPSNAAANTIKRIKNLFIPYKDYDKAHLHYSFQLNGYPHLGTIFSLTSLFAVSKLVSKDYNITIEIEVLDNAPAKEFIMDNKKYAINFSHYRENGELVKSMFFRSYEYLFQLLLEISETNPKQLKVIWYNELQSNPEFRKKLIHIIDNYDISADLFSPYDSKLKIRTPAQNVVL